MGEDVKQESGDQEDRPRFSAWYLVLGVAAVVWVLYLLQQHSGFDRLAYSDMKAAIATGKVAEVELTRTSVLGRWKPEG